MQTKVFSDSGFLNVGLTGAKSKLGRGNGLCLCFLFLMGALLVLSPVASADLLGTRKVLGIRVNFPNMSGAPSFNTVTSRLNGAKNNYDNYSYGKFTINPTVTSQVFTMPNNKAWYNNRGNAMANSAKNKASNAGYNIGSFNKIGYYYNLGTGLGNHAIVNGQNFWCQGNGGATMHELGHTFGWGHARRWAPNDQSKPLSSNGEVKVGSYHFMSGGGYDPTPFEKWKHGWITRRPNYTTDGDRTVRLYTFDQRDIDPANDLRTIRVTRKGFTRNGFTQSLWLGYRSKLLNNVSGSGKNYSLQQGLEAYWHRSSGSQAVMVDFHAGGGQDNHSLQPGETFADKAGKVYLTNLGRGGTAPNEYLDVRIIRGNYSDNQAPVPTWDVPDVVLVGVPFTVTVTANDPDGDEVVCQWTPRNAYPYGISAPAKTFTFNSAGTRTIKAIVSDMKGGTVTLTQTVIVTSPPVVVANSNLDAVDEGQLTTLELATFSDPETQDTHTATIEWGDASSDEGTVDETNGSGTVSGSHTYGDNGSYTVSITVTDDNGASASDSTTVTVLNVAPAAQLDTSAGTGFGGGFAFTGQVGVLQTHGATADDDGSDDLQFMWTIIDEVFGDVFPLSDTTYFNNGLSPDPLPSPQGIFPFHGEDAVEVAIEAPGVFTVLVTVSDDDGGISEDGLPKLVVGNEKCTRSSGLWRQQFALQGEKQVDEDTLIAYLAYVDFASAHFSEFGAAATMEEANALLEPRNIDQADIDQNGNENANLRDKAEQELFAAWLNVASGSVGLGEVLEDRSTAMETLLDVESFMQDTEARHHDYLAALKQLKLINNLACRD